MSPGSMTMPGMQTYDSMNPAQPQSPFPGVGPSLGPSLGPEYNGMYLGCSSWR